MIIDPSQGPWCLLETVAYEGIMVSQYGTLDEMTAAAGEFRADIMREIDGEECVVMPTGHIDQIDELIELLVPTLQAAVEKVLKES